jgi:hypothetical protein
MVGMRELINLRPIKMCADEGLYGPSARPEKPRLHNEMADFLVAASVPLAQQ